MGFTFWLSHSHDHPEDCREVQQEDVSHGSQRADVLLWDTQALRAKKVQQYIMTCSHIYIYILLVDVLYTVDTLLKIVKLWLIDSCCTHITYLYELIIVVINYMNCRSKYMTELHMYHRNKELQLKKLAAALLQGIHWRCLKGWRQGTSMAEALNEVAVVGLCWSTS